MTRPATAREVAKATAAFRSLQADVIGLMQMASSTYRLGGLTSSAAAIEGLVKHIEDLKLDRDAVERA